jgi:hypothetical protein
MTEINKKIQLKQCYVCYKSKLKMCKSYLRTGNIVTYICEDCMASMQQGKVDLLNVLLEFLGPETLSELINENVLLNYVYNRKDNE